MVVAFERESPWRKDAGGVGSTFRLQTAHPNVNRPANGYRRATGAAYTSKGPSFVAKTATDKNLNSKNKSARA
jgi:hypothetical protein